MIRIIAIAATMMKILLKMLSISGYLRILRRIAAIYLVAFKILVFHSLFLQ
jgi:hypothetical protein